MHLGAKSCKQQRTESPDPCRWYKVTALRWAPASLVRSSTDRWALPALGSALGLRLLPSSWPKGQGLVSVAPCWQQGKNKTSLKRAILPPFHLPLLSSFQTRPRELASPNIWGSRVRGGGHSLLGRAEWRRVGAVTRSLCGVCARSCQCRLTCAR